MKKLIFVLACLFVAIPCQARIITVDDDGPADFNTIQAAIDDSNDGDTVIVADGVYTDFHSMGITIYGKSITLRSENGPTSCIIDCNATESDLRRGFSFMSGEDSTLDGFTIINGIAPQQLFPPGFFMSVGGAIYCEHSNPTIRNCIISGNSTDGSNGGGIYSDHCDLTIVNCIFHNNSSVYGSGIYSKHSNLTVTNSILRGTTPDEIGGFGGTSLITYSNIQGGWPGLGNIDADPCFADANNGDFRLKSQTGRWNPNTQKWVQDDVTSPCIDAGNPGCPLSNEPNDVNNVRINMGAYGGTAEASKSPANWRSIADMTNDWVVDSNDLRVYVDYWLEAGECIPSDFDRSLFVDFSDFAIFGLQWSYPSTSEPGMTFHVDNCNMEAGLSWTSAAESNEPRFSVWVEGRYIHFEDQMYANCCPDELGLDKEINDNEITLYEIGYGGLCDCMCYFPVTATLGPFEDGTYTVEVYDNYGHSLGVVEVTIGGSPEPGMTYHIEDCNMEAGQNWLAAAESNEPRFSVWVEDRYIHFTKLNILRVDAIAYAITR
ncbi:MAG: hypothetical protein ACYSWZ_24785 [Planctomycetota bacterium]|jgi:hypothetical protein